MKEPFKGLFTQGMVCHETYKDQNNNWLHPDEVTTEDGKNYYKLNNLKEGEISEPIIQLNKITFLKINKIHLKNVFGHKFQTYLVKHQHSLHCQ